MLSICLYEPIRKLFLPKFNERRVCRWRWLDSIDHGWRGWCHLQGGVWGGNPYSFRAKYRTFSWGSYPDHRRSAALHSLGQKGTKRKQVHWGLLADSTQPGRSQLGRSLPGRYTRQNHQNDCFAGWQYHNHHSREEALCHSRAGHWRSLFHRQSGLFRGKFSQELQENQSAGRIAQRCSDQNPSPQSWDSPWSAGGAG